MTYKLPGALFSWSLVIKQ